MTVEHPVQKAIPAATLVIFREGEPGDTPVQLLMVRRADTMVFAAGAAVFPGGRVDADDQYLAKIFAPALEPDDGAARIAAIRETLEETGLAVGIAHQSSAAILADARKAILKGTDFSEIVQAHGWVLHPDQLIPFARWRPAHLHERIFDTRFYIAHDHQGTSEVTVDTSENSHAFWTSAQAMIDRADSDEGHIIYPTRRNLERLAQFASFAEARDHALAHDVRIITPYFEERYGERHLCIESGLGYPVTSEPVRSIKRG